SSHGHTRGPRSFPTRRSSDLVLTVRDALGARRVLMHIPVRMMLPPVFIMEHVMPNPMVTLGQLRLLEKNNITRLDSVLHAFGFRSEEHTSELQSRFDLVCRLL